MSNTDLFVSDEERYVELDDFYKSTYRDNEVKEFIEGNEEKVEFIKENYPAIIEYLKKEFPPHTVGVYYANTEQVDDRKIAVLATDASFFPLEKREGQHHFSDKEHFLSGLNLLTEIGEIVTWSKEAYIQNFPKILDYLEKHDGLDVTEVRDMYAKTIEHNRNDTHSPWLKSGGELAIRDPGPSVETTLTKLVEKAKYDEFKRHAGPGNGTHRQALKYYKDTVLRAVLKEEKLKECELKKQELTAKRNQYRSNNEKVENLKRDMTENNTTSPKNNFTNILFKANLKQTNNMGK